MKIKHDIREFECVSCNATFTGYKDGMDVYSTVENEHRPEQLHVSGCPQCGCDDAREVDTTEPDDDNGYGDDLDGVAVEEPGVDTKREERAGIPCTSTPSPSPNYCETCRGVDALHWNIELGLWICANCEAGTVEGDTSKCIN